MAWFQWRQHYVTTQHSKFTSMISIHLQSCVPKNKNLCLFVKVTVKKSVAPFLSGHGVCSICKSRYPLCGYPDLSANFMAPKNPDILKWKSGFFGCMKIVKNHACEFVMVRYISEFHSPLLTAVSLHLHMWCPCTDCIKERLYFSFSLDESEE